MLAYTVIATLPDAETASEYIAWLHGGHLRAVVAGGASEARVVRIDDPPEPIQVEARYTFAGREVFDRYLRDHAPALREEGTRRFGPQRGVTLVRRVGTFI